MLDGTIIQKPAGRAGFLPQPISVPPLQWPQSLRLVKPVPGIEADWFGFNHVHVPPCVSSISRQDKDLWVFGNADSQDQDANVEFRLCMSAARTHFIQGELG